MEENMSKPQMNDGDTRANVWKGKIVRHTGPDTARVQITAPDSVPPEYQEVQLALKLGRSSVVVEQVGGRLFACFPDMSPRPTELPPVGTIVACQPPPNYNGQPTDRPEAARSKIAGAWARFPGSPCPPHTPTEVLGRPHDEKPGRGGQPRQARVHGNGCHSGVPHSLR